MATCYTPSANRSFTSTSAAMEPASTRRWLTGLADGFSQVMQQYEVKCQQRIDRDAFRHLIKLDEALLDDIGVTREAVACAAELPLHENAAIVLHEVTRARRKTA